MSIELVNVSKAFGETQVLRGLSERFAQGESVCVMGRSGLGKTTLARIVMGLEKPDAGAVRGAKGKRFAAAFQEDRLVERLSAQDPELTRQQEDVLAELLPAPIIGAMREALPLLGCRLRGFDCPDAVLTAPETRSSSPVRIVRGENRQSEIAGLYPCGEGAGYAGGIMSAAVDGIRAAFRIMEEYKPE